MERLIKAWQNSIRALRALAAHETAVQQELGLLILSLPLGWMLSTSWRGYALLVGSILFLLIVEILNTGIEATCDAISREFNLDIQLAKDCGSLAVLGSIILVAMIWGLALWERVAGVPV